MGALLALLSALCYGSSDFAAGVGGRRGAASAVTMIAQPFGLAAAVIALVVLPHAAPDAAALWWGTVSGIGSGVGTAALYRGLTTGQMTVVAPLSAVLAAGIPALVGIALGDRLSPLSLSGIALAVPAVLLVSRQTTATGTPHGGVLAGLVAGSGFALLFIGLARAGTAAGAWPLLPGQVTAVIIVALVTVRLRPARGSWRPSLAPGVLAGVLGGVANLLYLAATGSGQLAVVAVLTALYPAVTVLLARLVLHEQWTRVQVLGLLVAAIAVGAISAG